MSRLNDIARTPRPADQPHKRELAQIRPKDRASWREWLTNHHASAKGVWVIWNKKTPTPEHLSLEDAVEEALCFGWIDSTLKPIDDERSRLMFTPRRPKSIWSRHNKRRVASLIKRGLMTESGLQVVRRAKRDGSWNALNAVDALRLPDDLTRALAANSAAKRNFDACSASRKKALLWWAISAKRPETRSRRIAEIVRQMS